MLALYPIRFEHTKAPQNDHLDLSFVKDFHVEGVSWQSEQSNLALLGIWLLILADILGPVG